MVKIPGYHIEQELYNSSRTLVYRAVREDDQKPVVIKILKNPYPNFNELLQFRNQYTISKNLDIPGIIRPYSLQAYQNGYALIMEDMKGISLQNYINKRSLTSIEEILSIAVEITNILHNLHQNQVIHKDIKPANILINPQTKQIKLIDFSIASLLPKETQSIKNPHSLEGTLAYISPEQTGRMNRGIDYRADFYSLGVTLYELIMGELPFESEDPMELIHCHITKIPPSVNSKYSQVISDIVLKLMAKNAEDRYQSALGLKYDLEICLKQLKETGNIEKFEIGKRDISDRFLIPEKLYGREKEVEELLTAFERVSRGNRELMLVAGFSGIGKTAVVKEIHKPIVKQRGYFIKGKFDQFKRNIPFSAFLQAFRDLIGQLRTESDAQLLNWKNIILQALGENGQVIIDVIPELENIIGKQPPVPELSGDVGKNRFSLLLQKFIQVFTTKEHPLVIFLDDLQWSDSASLSLINLLMTGENGYLLIIGAYRDNEVFPAHPLMLILEKLNKNGCQSNTITLQNLSNQSLNKLIADTLYCSTNIAQNLTDIIYQKTEGNPFFATQFLKKLYQDKLIYFDKKSGYWQCDITKVREMALTSNVVEFMATQLQKFSIKTRDTLKFAACIGNQFDLEKLAIISEQSKADVARILWKSLQSGLIVPQSELYKFYLDDEEQDIIFHGINNIEYRFLHDRVQQAAYLLIPENCKQETHLKIGKLLLKETPKSKLEENIFEIVNQLNIGIELIIEQIERNQLAKLNLLAGRKAKIATAYHAAIDYFNLGIKLLTGRTWEDNYELTLKLYQEAAETAYLNTNFEEMNQLVEEIHNHGETLLDRIKVYEVQIQAYMAQNQFPQAIQTGLEVLELLDINFPETPNQSDIQAGMERTFANLAERNPLDLADISVMTDSSKVAALRILNCVFPCAYQAAPQLLPLLVMEQVNLSITYGNSALSATGYGMWALILCAIVGDISTGYQFGQLALSLLERFNSKEIQAGTMFIVNADVKHYKEHVKATLEPLQSAYSIGLETGDLKFAALATNIYAYHAYLCGNHLLELNQKITSFNQVLDKFQQINTLQLNQALQQAIINLSTEVENPCQLIGEVYDQQKMLPLHQQANDGTAIFYIYFNQLILNYLLGNIETGLENAMVAEKYLFGVTGNLVVPVFYFYNSLVRLANYRKNTDNIEFILDKIEANQQKMQHWSHHAPMNFLHKYHLVEAEKNRILGNNWQAVELYDLTIKLAKENEYVNEEALANELAAKFYLNLDKEKIASVYMQEAYYCYSRWGAKAKIDDLEKHYPQLLIPILQTQNNDFHIKETFIQASRSTTAVSYTFDFASILKATQALSNEIQLEELISRLLIILIENTGADKAALIFIKDETLTLEAIATKDNGVKQLSIPYEISNDIPHRVVNYVKRNLKVIVLDNATTENDFIADNYLIQRRPYSLLCTPILNQGKLIAILYLENKLTIGAFTSERLETINILCTQAAIFLENARLYKNLEQSEIKFRAFVEDVNDFIYSVSEDVNFTYLSPQFKQMWGYEVEDFLNKSFVPLIHPEDLPKVIAAAKIILESGKKVSGVEFRTQRKDNSYFWITCSNAPIKDKNGKVIGYRGIARDITYRKKAEATVIEKSQELEKTLQELKQTQLQMVQNEKMATLGNLVAGVAHEVNNPIGFLKGSINNAQDFIQYLLAHIECYQEYYPNPTEEVKEHAEDIDLEFVFSDLPKLLDSMKLATRRIQDISTSLRTFSRADTSEKVACKIHEGIDSTILILKYRLKANHKRPEIEIIKEYGNLPPVKCFLGQLNQVFMNIIANAIDALDSLIQGKTFTEVKHNFYHITIKTEVDAEKNIVIICIQDNGPGIPESVKERIFDNLFTTKGVGQGTGLGLAIARQIVEETHGGKLSCNSTLGEGTEFVIELPI